MNPSVTRVVLVLAFALIPNISATRWEADLFWCYNEPLFQGDFNGDGRTDLLCHLSYTYAVWIAYADTAGHFTGTNWQQNSHWCSYQLHIGDFNRDGRSDILCYDARGGHIKISFANTAGNFADGTSWEGDLNWCQSNGDEVHISDFNGDGRDDMLCHDTIDGDIGILFANDDGNFAHGTRWEAALGWCWHGGAELFFGDFNGDGKGDMLCHDSGNGHKWIKYANQQGRFAGTGWENGMGCIHWGASLRFGDINGDRKDDMVCQDKNGYVWYFLANRQNGFNYEATWEADLDWCTKSSDQLYLGDYNGDLHADMLCHNTGSGYKKIIYYPTRHGYD